MDEDLNFVVDKFLYYIRKHNITNSVDLKKYYYTRNFSEDKIIRFKKIFSKYGVMNLFNCLFFYLDKQIKDKETLYKKIKGVI